MFRPNWLKSNFVNFVWFQVLWFFCVLGTNLPALWFGAIFMTLGYVWVMRDELNKQKILAVAITVALGIGLDNLWLQLGFLSYLGPQSYLVAGFPPFWIVLLWFGLALAFQYSLRWLQGRAALAAIFSFIACPISYYSAERLGALTVNATPTVFFASVALSWALVIPLLMELNRYLEASEWVVSNEH